MKYLGEHFDVHCGGIDHVPVHHTNEIAQSEAATGPTWVNYWLHGEFLLMGREKMAKSAGNFLTLSSLTEKGYHPLDFRFFCLGAHYRTQLVFTFEGLDAARTGRQGLMERMRQLKAEAPGGAEEAEGKALDYLKDFETHLADDMNMPRCLADLWTLLRDTGVAPRAEAVALPSALTGYWAWTSARQRKRRSLSTRRQRVSWRKDDRPARQGTTSARMRSAISCEPGGSISRTARRARRYALPLVKEEKKL